MGVDLRCFWAPKAGHAANEYEDAFCVYVPESGVRCRVNEAPAIDHSIALSGVVRLAIADGASESSFSSGWAKLLVRGFCRSSGSPSASGNPGAGKETVKDGLTLQGFERATAVWHRCYGGRSLPWYAEHKRDLGAHAAFLGLELNPPSANSELGTWHATAIGDSCMFQFRQGELLTAFPIEDAACFSQNPWLLTSRDTLASQASHLKRLHGQWKVGDEFVLLTDAAASWLLRGLELRADPLDFLRSLKTQQGFEDWVAGQRAELIDETPRLRNDDVTLLWFGVSHPIGPGNP